MKPTHRHALFTVVVFAACSGKERPFGSGGVPAASDPGPTNMSAPDAVSMGMPASPVTPASGPEGVSPESVNGESIPITENGVDSSGTVLDATSDDTKCAADAGGCSTADAGTVAPAPCTPTGPRQCTSNIDNDCDGQLDNIIDDVCRCVPGTTETCDAHPGFDGQGACRAGARVCVLGAGNGTSDWTACEGAVGPLPADTCAIANDDSDCDGLPGEGCTCVNGETQPCGPSADEGVCQQGTSTCVDGSFQECIGAVLAGARDCTSAADNDCDGSPDNTLDAFCQCVVGTTQVCGAHPEDGIGSCRAGQQQCQAGSNNSSSAFEGPCIGSVGPTTSDSCAIAGDDSNCDGNLNGGCACGDGVTNGSEICDGGLPGSTEIGACNPLCTGFYTRKSIRRSLGNHSSNLGGIAGADAICVGDFGPGWKALLSASTRRASVTPFVGDGQVDWVIKPYTYYFNADEQLIWRTDAVALLGASAGRAQPVLAPIFDTTPVDGGYNFPWSGFDINWTTLADQTCSDWTSTDPSQFGSFIAENLQNGIAEPCNGNPFLFLLCVEQ